MMYHLLDEAIYRNSRYELMQLLEDVFPTRHGKIETIDAFNEIALTYEQVLDKCFPSLPFSEERLAIFSRVYSDAGFVNESLVRAVESGIRAIVVSVLRDASVRGDVINIRLQRRRFFEADMVDG